jgi:hypothetical protein
MRPPGLEATRRSRPDAGISASVASSPFVDTAASAFSLQKKTSLQTMGAHFSGRIDRCQQIFVDNAKTREQTARPLAHEHAYAIDLF